MRNKQKILILNSYPHIGGAEKFIIALGLGLKEKGWEVFLGLRMNSDLIKEAIKLNFFVLPLPFTADFDPLTIGLLSHFYKEQKVSIILSTDERSARIGGILARKHDEISHIARLRSVWDPHKKESKFRRLRYKFNYNLFLDLIVTNSEAARKDLIKNYHISPQRIQVIYNGINLPHILKMPFSPGIFRNNLHLSKDAFIITQIGRISPPKNQIESIEIADHLFDKIHNAYLIIVGKSVNKDYYRLLSKKRATSKFKERIFILGHRNDIGQILLDSNILLSTSTAEGLPNVFIEAGFFGKPIISRDVCGNKEILSDGINGFMLPENASAEDFADAILEIYDKPQLAQEMGKNAQRIIQKKFSYEEMINNYHKLFKQFMLNKKVYKQTG